MKNTAPHEAQDIAQANNWYLFEIVLDGKTRRPRSGRFAISGPLPPECYDELAALLRRWSEEGKI